MNPELETRQILPNIETFTSAKAWLNKMRTKEGYSCDYDLQFIQPTYYIVTKHGVVIGMGTDYQSAIMAAQVDIVRSTHSKYVIACGVK